MPDLITEQKTIEILKRLRSPKIVIRNPESGNKQVTFQVVEAEYHNNVFNSEKVVRTLSKELDNESMVSDITFTDPLSNQVITLKVATVAKAVEQYFVDLYNAENT